MNVGTEGLSLPFRVKVINEEGSSTIPLVFLHDALGSISSWRDWPERLCLQRHIKGYVIERIGHGQNVSMDHPCPHDIEKYFHFEALEYLPTLLASLGLNQVDLIGFSDGATIALLFGTQFSSRINKIVSLAAHIYIEDETRSGIAEATRGEQTLAKKISDHHIQPEILIERWKHQWLEGDGNWSISDKLIGIQSPTLIVQGSNDQFATKEQALEIKEHIPLSKVWIPEADHFLAARIPDLLVERITHFLS